jgi:hypothetical protein
MYPATLERNFIPNSTAAVSESVMVTGRSSGPQTEQGHITGGGSRLSDTDLTDVPRVAVIAADCAVDTAFAAAENCPIDAPAAIATDDGTSKFPLSLDKATVAPPVNAFLLRVRVHVVLAPDCTVAPSQARLDKTGGATTVSTAFAEPPFAAALRTALLSVADDTIEATKPPAAEPAGTTTDSGTETTGSLEDSVTATPPAGAMALSVTVQLAVAGATTLAGAHDNWVGTTGGGGTTTSAPVPVRLAATPVAEAAAALNETGRSAPCDVKVNEAIATTPSAIGFAFIPLATQATEPEAEWHFTVFPAVVAEPPARTETKEKSPGAKPRFHWTAAGPPPPVKRRANETVLPGADAAGSNVRF